MKKLTIFDIHSHILPQVDDGSKSPEMSFELLKMMRNDGITHVAATPHFDPMYQNTEEFMSAVSDAKQKLMQITAGQDFPQICIGAEVRYFKGIGNTAGIKQFCIGKSEYILLELEFGTIDDTVIADIRLLSYKLGLIPVIAHVERYSKFHGYKKLLKLFADGTCMAQVNAQSFFDGEYKKILRKLMSKGYVSLIASDTHSPVKRPPMISEALKEIAKICGTSYCNKLILNSEHICKKIFGETYAK